MRRCLDGAAIKLILEPVMGTGRVLNKLKPNAHPLISAEIFVSSEYD